MFSSSFGIDLAEFKLSKTPPPPPRSWKEFANIFFGGEGEGTRIKQSRRDHEHEYLSDLRRRAV